MYAVFACEAIYQGLHGMYDLNIIDTEDEKEAEEWGEAISYDIMDSFSDIDIALRDEALYAGFEEDSEEFYDYIEELKRDNVYYRIWKVKDTKGMTIEELRDEFYNNPKTFVKEFCEEEE